MSMYYVKRRRIMELTLYTEDYFSAAHRIEGYDGKCARMHGHTWKVCVWVRGDEAEKASDGILWDFNDLRETVSDLDHTVLNDVLGNPPTVENITVYVLTKLKMGHPALAFRVRVYENIVSRRSYCEAGDF
jgi:6-pyruvoyltetrahydropterin/6-carboxytetrahydropterin synthase